MTLCLLGLGANVGDPHQTIRSAVTEIEDSPGLKLVTLSGMHQTTPVGGPPGQAIFTNAAALIESSLPPDRLIKDLQAIEHRHGRQRRVRWASRTLDLDLLLYGQETIESEDLQTPHPRMTYRPFVLAPAVEVAGELIHRFLTHSYNFAKLRLV